MSDPAVIRVEVTVGPDWIDFNGHMRDAYYMLVVSWANDALMDAVGMGPAYLRETGCTFYNLENHIRFLREAHEGERLRADLRVIDVDAKRVHLISEVRAVAENALCALNEAVLLHVRQGAPAAAAPFPPEVAARLQALCDGSADWPRPARRAGPLGLRRAT
ncbi:MAG: thioesterase family protein [Pseudomonadota bacterium]